MESGDLGMLENALQQLVKEWERFFAGVRRTPPQTERTRLGRRLRMLTEDPSAKLQEQFRLEQLQNRFQTYSQMWERMVREREEGRGHLPGGVRPAGGAPPSPATEGRPNARAAAAVDDDGVGPLFEQYVAAKRQLGQNTRVDLSAFSDQLEAQRRQLEGRLGHRVRFEVVVDGSKVKLAARKASGGR